MSRIKEALKAIAQIPRELQRTRREISNMRKVVSQRGKALDAIGHPRGSGKSSLETLFGLREPVRLQLGLERLGISEGVSLHTYLHSEAVSADIYRDRIWEATETRFVLENVKNGDVVIDLGANIGYYATIFSKLVGTRGQVHAFEPDDKNYRTLLLNLALNNCHNVRPVKAVVSDSEGIAVFQRLPEVNDGAHMVVHQKTGETNVNMTCHPKLTLDQYVKYNPDIKRIDFIKMDTQGSEPFIVNGARAAIEANRNHLKMVVEFCPDWVQQIAGLDPIEYLGQFKSMGFALFHIDNLANSVVPLEDFEAFVRLVRACDGTSWPKGINYADLVVVPKGYQGVLLPPGS